MTGGNTFAPKLINLAYPGEADQAALDEAVLRARYMLQHAASMELSVVQDADSFRAHVKITNETGHKLPSGYPEGRRTWINIIAINHLDSVIYESGSYDANSATLTKDTDAKVYEIKPGLSPGLATALGLIAGPSFHFVLNDTIYADNRIPPRGFTNAGFAAIGSPVVDYTYADGQYWDDTYYGLPRDTRKVVAKLHYQTSSKEFIEFLQQENVTDHWGDSLYSWWSSNGKSPPELMQADSVNVEPAGLSIALSVFLEGAYAGGDSMSVSPLFGSSAPTAQPFSDAPFSGTWLENDTTLSVSTWNSNYINWVIVSLRTDSSAASEVFTTPAILTNDGTVVDTAGSSLTIPGIAAGAYFVVVRERNHLSIMTPVAVEFSSGSGSWDFTSGLPSAFSRGGPPMKILPDGRTAMFSGDPSIDGQVTAADFNLWLVDTKAVSTGYLQSDLDFDAQSTAADFNLWLVSTKAVSSSQVPE
jgi:hypothetical protein